ARQLHPGYPRPGDDLMTTVAPQATGQPVPPPPTGTSPDEKPTAKQGLISRYLFPAIAVVLLVWGVFLATGDKVQVASFDPAAEFDLSAHEGRHVIGGEWIVGSIGGVDIDLGINKGVVYLAIAVLVSLLLAFYINRRVVQRLKVHSKTQ